MFTFTFVTAAAHKHCELANILRCDSTNCKELVNHSQIVNQPWKELVNAVRK